MSTGKSELKIDIYADGADKAKILKYYSEKLVKGFTTNPSLMAKAGVRDYSTYAKELLSVVKDLPISFEVFSDEFNEMKEQALKIGSWGENVYVKIPITNTKSKSSIPLIRELLANGLKLNVTAIFTQEQLQGLKSILKDSDDVIISIFAGRIADTGIDPMPLMENAVKEFASFRNAKILWASTRETLNVYQAEQCGCHIITVTDDIISKLPLHGKSLEEYSLETVKTFYSDAQKAGFIL